MTVHAQAASTGAHPAGAPGRRTRGQRNALAGDAAERQAAAVFAARGAASLARRWRGRGGEIDLVLREGDTIVFVEVKRARTTDQAIAHLRPAQMRRIHAAAAEYIGTLPAGQLTPVRFDLAAVDGAGHVEIIENAFGHF
ncbi:YraN family protein [Roseovarius salinarum]|uniref:YraN family protein n=1 Tax=Roseovarius salinarum TaxID=1981892 RepID=UPI000C33FDE2|nr:YraN family protein [Roseovarius salinarum]